MELEARIQGIRFSDRSIRSYPWQECHKGQARSINRHSLAVLESKFARQFSDGFLLFLSGFAGIM
jgi:hypothetical protein